MYTEPQAGSVSLYPKLACMLCNLCAVCATSAITQDVHFLWFIGPQEDFD